MFPYSRLEDIFEYVHSSTISAESLSNKLNVSQRTIRSDILLMNEILENHGAKICLKRKAGYYLNILDENEFKAFLSLLNSSTGQHNGFKLDTSKDRIKFLLQSLLYSNYFISIEELSNLVFITKNTLYNYTKTISNILSEYDLELIISADRSLKIFGNEENKRKCILEEILNTTSEMFITGFTKEEQALFSDIDLSFIESTLYNLLNENGEHSSDLNRKNLITHCALCISRIIHNHTIQNNTKIEMPEIKGFHQLIKELENHFEIKINEGEKYYLYTHVAVNVSGINYHTYSVNPEMVVKKLLDKIYDNYYFDLRNDEILNRDLVSHFRSIFQTKYFSLNKRNPLLNTIKSNFPLPFEITLTCVSQVLTNEKIALTEDEIGYISLHIGAAIERCFSGIIQKKNVILICGFGTATSRMLEARINSFFKDKIIIKNRVSYSEFKNMKEEDLQMIDFAISTIPITEDESLPTICVDFSLNKKDIETISRFLTVISSNASKKIDKFFDKNIFIQHKSFKSKEELLSTMCDQMVKENLTSKSFFKSVMERESLAHTNMNEVFALPHALQVCSSQTKVAVAILDEPLLWNDNDTVQIVFLLAIRADENIDIEHLYDIFIQIVNNPKLQNEIITCSDYQDFLHILSSSLKEI